MVTDKRNVAFGRIKAEFRRKIVLLYFSKEEKKVPQTDASKKALGAVILWKRNPVHYASRTDFFCSEELSELGKRMHGSFLEKGKISLIFWRIFLFPN